jgi:DNA-binding transcriptional ArsR family regulator
MRDSGAGRARRNDAVHGSGREAVALPVLCDLGDEVGMLHGRLLNRSTFLICSKLIEHRCPCQADSDRVRCVRSMAVERSPRAPVLDLGQRGGVQVEIDVAEAAEVLMSICAVADRDDHDTFDLGAEWLRARLETVPADLREGIDALRLGSMKIAAHLLGIVWELPRPRTFASFMERLAATDPIELKLHLFGHFDTTSHLLAGDVVERAARGDRDAIDRVLDEVAEYSDKHALYRDLLELDAPEVKERLLDVLPRWHDHVFAPHAEEWRSAAEHDAEAKRALAARHTPEQLVELATRGYQYSPPPAIRTLAFFPSWFMRPWVILWEHRSTKIFCYPIAAPAEEGTSPAEVARVYKALGDEGRLRLLRRLSEGPMKLGEAAAELGVAKSTAHHHLAILRQAGFVTIRDEDEKIYSLRRDLLPQAGELLTAYLGSSSRSSATTA